MSNNPHNPFAGPNGPTQQYPTATMNRGGRKPGLGYVKQVPILAIMTIVQGVLLLLMAAGCIAYGCFIFFMPTMMPPEEQARMQAQAGAVFEIMGWVMIGLGVFILVISILHFIAGYRALIYRGRIFMIVTWFLGLTVSITMYCAPTCIGLAIWGMIVFFNPAVAEAFRMVEGGVNRKEIQNHFYN